MIQESGKGNEDGARPADVRAERELPAFPRRCDWDNPCGDEPSVPIIYEPA